jgi:uncharacterized coiled-coil protein SlyX
MTDAERITRLEERLTHLQKHVTEQDRVILELTETLSRLRRELDVLRLRATNSAAPEDGGEMPADERPPHY